MLKNNKKEINNKNNDISFEKNGLSFLNKCSNISWLRKSSEKYFTKRNLKIPKIPN